MTLITGVSLSLVSTVTNSVSRHKANGSFVLDAKGEVRGSALNQSFTWRQWFQSRPSAVVMPRFPVVQ